MPNVPIHIPQIGEGLQEARLVAVLKQPGDFVKRDEPIYQMETDKAVMDVESPYEGVLTKWLASVDTVLPIGAEIAMMQVGDEITAAPAPSHGAPVAASPSPNSGTSDVLSVCIPQIGEGLQEARLVAVLKQPGDFVKRDEPIYQMETDKAVMDVESPYEGVLLEWCAPVDTVLPIGAEIAKMQSADPSQTQMAAGHGPAPTAAATSPTAANTEVVAPAARRGDIPPRTRAYAKERGITEAILATIPATKSRLMPEDIDAFLAGGSATSSPAASSSASPRSAFPHQERALSQKQRLLSSRLVRGNQLVVPGTITVVARWNPIESLRTAYKQSGGDFKPSGFTIFAYCCVQALKDHPLFRSTLVGDSSVRTYDRVYLGIAVALPNDELAIAVVQDADLLDWPAFAAATRDAIERARAGQDQAHEAVTLSLTNMQAFGLRDAVPVVVPPAIATLYLGEVYRGLDPMAEEPSLIQLANLALTFDHRLINGVGGAEFLNDVRRHMEHVLSVIPSP